MQKHTSTSDTKPLNVIPTTFNHQRYGTLPLQCHCLTHDPGRTRRLITGRYYLARIRTILHDRGQS